MLDLIINNPKYIWAVISFVFGIIVLISIIRIHLSKKYKKFNLINMMAIDSATGEPSDSKLRLNVAFVITAWAFIYLTMADKLTEWYVIAFLGAWVTDRIFARNSTNQQIQYRHERDMSRIREDEDYGNTT